MQVKYCVVHKYIGRSQIRTLPNYDYTAYTSYEMKYKYQTHKLYPEEKLKEFPGLSQVFFQETASDGVIYNITFGINVF